MNPVIRCWLGLALLAIATPTVLGAGAHPDLIKSYPINPSIGPELATFTSSADCTITGCTITHRISSDSVDRIVVATWLDTSGKPLMAPVVNSYWRNFFAPNLLGGYLEATESYSRGITTVANVMGTADFRGTSPGSNPCGVGYVCKPPNGPEYYYFPSMFGPPPSDTPGGKQLRVAAPAATYGSIASGLAGVLLNPDFTVAQDNDGRDLRVSLLTFTSEVESINNAFRYSYSVANATNRAIVVNWADAGIAGEIPAFGSLQGEHASSLEPGLLNSTVMYTLDRQYVMGATVYAPIPEPGTFLTFTAGLLVLIGYTYRRPLHSAFRRWYGTRREVALTTGPLAS